MTKYETGNWYGWNGGECPVHPETIVECICLEGVHTSHTDGDAGEWNWDDEICPIIAFRVIKEYKEPPKPREFWINPTDGISYPTLKEFRSECGEYSEYIHVREVI